MDYLIYELNKVLEYWHELNDIHDFENHSQDNEEMQNSQNGFLLKIEMSWIIWQYDCVRILYSPYKVENVQNILQNVYYGHCTKELCVSLVSSEIVVVEKNSKE